MEIVCDYLGDAGYRSVGCADGQEALATIERQSPPPAAIILDVKMPRLDGYGVIRWVKRHPVYRQIAIIILTATKVLRITHGAPPQPNPFTTIRKPCEAAPLLAAVRQVLHGA
ncbi:MAG: response regulator [Candidatus Omnitrophica bacterium]|nr:response regulator [Candidatus Omnitrophota bacterium]